MTSVQRLVA